MRLPRWTTEGEKPSESSESRSRIDCLVGEKLFEAYSVCYIVTRMREGRYREVNKD